MAQGLRVIGGVVVGAAAWALLWVAGTRLGQLAFPSALTEGQPIISTPALLSLIAYSVVLSVLAGYVAALVAVASPWTAAWVLAVVQLAVGIVTEVSMWDLMPPWYHIAFLVLLAPATIYGAALRIRSTAGTTRSEGDASAA
jgi:hypothetical protein